MEHTGAGPEELSIRHAESPDGGTFVIEQGGRRLGELVWCRGDAGEMIIEHTEVDEALRGRGAARMLVDAGVDFARRIGAKIAPVCPYAKKVLERDPTYRDVLR